jgi:hypothetical protein
MLPALHPTENQLGRDITAYLPAAPPADRVRDADRDVWELAAPYLKVRDNDGHTIYAYGLARALLAAHPEAEAEVVLPAILLHDTGWSQAPPDQILEAIAPGGWRPGLVLLHEGEGARIAREILTELGRPAAIIDRVVEIIDGHDSRLVSLSIEDSLVKDADKLWRLTPHGVDTVMRWFGLARDQAYRLIASRVHDHLFTDTARTMAQVLAAVAWVDSSPERVALG